MSRWNIGARHQTPQSKLLEQEPSADGRRLTSGEVRFERLRLAHDMVTLVLTVAKGSRMKCGWSWVPSVRCW
jgi:L-fucose isomerase-like protein